MNVKVNIHKELKDILLKIIPFINLAYDRGLQDGKLEQCNKEKEMQIGIEIGRDEAWEAARKIVCPPDCYEGGLYGNKVNEIFGRSEYLSRSIFTDFTASEAIQKIIEYEKKNKKEDFDIGDEVKDNVGIVSVVLGKTKNKETIYLLNNAFDLPVQGVPAKFLKKTGKHYDELKDILSKLGDNGIKDVADKIVNKIKEQLSHETT